MLQWNKTNQPKAFASLDDDVRNAALNEANALLEAGRHPIRAMSTGIARALEPNGDFGPTWSVSAVPGAWQLQAIGRDDEPEIFPTLETALLQGCRRAKEAKSGCFVFDIEGSLVETFEYYSGPSDEGLDVAPTDDGWIVRAVAPNPVNESFDTKKEAMKRARELAKKRSVRIHVHYASGELSKTIDHS